MRLVLTFVAVIATWGSLPAQAESIRVTLLGTGTPMPNPDRMGSATLVEAGEQKLLFDAGRGTSIRLVEARVEPADLTAVFITHFHSDHVVGLPDVWLLGHVLPFYHSRPLELIGPPGTRSMARGLSEAFAKDIELRTSHPVPGRSGPELKPTEFQEAGVVLERGGVKVTAFPVNHVPDSYGYRIDYEGHSVVISGDTSPSETLLAAATDVDLLVHEIMAMGEKFLASRPPAARSGMRSVLSTHTTPPQAAEILRETGPRLAVFTHVALIGVSKGDVLEKIRSRYDGRVEMGEDLMTIMVGDEVTVQRP